MSLCNLTKQLRQIIQFVWVSARANRVPNWSQPVIIPFNFHSLQIPLKYLHKAQPQAIAANMCKNHAIIIKTYGLTLTHEQCLFHYKVHELPFPTIINEL